MVPEAQPKIAQRFRGCVKTPRATNSSKNRRSHFGYNAFLLPARLIRPTFSSFKMSESEFSHSLFNVGLAPIQDQSQSRRDGRRFLRGVNRRVRKKRGLHLPQDAFL